MSAYAVIMAGGVGSRFWPRSKQDKPKHLLNIFGESTLLQDTVARIEGLIPKDNTYIITNDTQKPRVVEQAAGIPVENILSEPFGKNTAACIGFASAVIKRKDPEAVTVVLPSDHFIQNVELFQETLKKGIRYANELNGLVTIGMKPTKPETGYGYIQIDEKRDTNGVTKALTYAEKPNFSTAQRFVNSGDFLWNSGIFIWRVDVILEEIKKHMSDLFDSITEIEKALGDEKFQSKLKTIYGQIRRISIDYGLMEKSENVYIMKGEFDWIDAGSWDAIYELSVKDSEGNAKVGEIYTEETFDSYVFTPKKFTAVIGVENLIVIETDDSLLICDRNNAQNVKHVIDYLKMKNRTDLL